MTVRMILMLSMVLYCACGKHESKTINNSGVSQIQAGGGFTFVIKDTGKPLSMGSGSGDDTNNELWLKNDTTGEDRLLVTCKDDKEMENEICDIQNPKLTSDKTKVYFESSAWATSNSIHVVDLKTGKEKFVSDGNGFDLLGAGKYAGDIIVNKHKYNKGTEGGSYDHFFVVDENGKELIDLGENIDKGKL